MGRMANDNLVAHGRDHHDALRGNGNLERRDVTSSYVVPVHRVPIFQTVASSGRLRRLRQAAALLELHSDPHR